MSKPVPALMPGVRTDGAQRSGARLHRSAVVLLFSAVVFAMVTTNAMGDITPVVSSGSPSWTTTEAPLPSSSFGSYIAALSCPAAESCVAIAGNVTPEDLADGSGYILTETASHWSEQAIPLPLGATEPLNLTQVRLTCAEVGYCVAFTNSLEGRRGYILTETAGVWTSQAEPSAPDGSSLVITALACPQANACVAVGSNTARTIPVILTESGTVWSAASAPQPSKALCLDSLQGKCELTALSCPMSGHCTATGVYVKEETVYPEDPPIPVVVNYILTQTPGNWSASALPPDVPRIENSGENTPPVYTPITALACPQPEHCVAIARSIQGRLFAPAQELFSTGLAYVFSENTPGDWSTATLPLPAEDGGGVLIVPEYAAYGPLGGTADISSLSCPAVDACAAGGWYSTAILTDAYGAPLMTSNVILSLASGAWQAVTTPPTNGVTPIGVDVSCATVGFCAAVRSTVSPGTNAPYGVYIESDGVWSEQLLPTPPTFVVSPYSDVLSLPDVVSCPAVNSCTIAADYSNPSGAARILIISQGGVDNGLLPSQGPQGSSGGGGGSGASSGSGSGNRPSSPASSCPTYTVIDSRGSGENIVVHGKLTPEISPPAAFFASELRHRHRSSSLSLISNPYPAAGFGWSPRKLLNLIGAGSEIAPVGAYHSSVVDGEKWLRTEVQSVTTACGRRTHLFLLGYSQGAQVTGDVYQRYLTVAQKAEISAVVLFGDPYFNPSDKLSDRGAPYWPKPGILGKRPGFGDRRVWSYCHLHDIICQYPNVVEIAKYGWSAHKTYPADAATAASHF
jgi:hypothetical protein